MTWRRQRWRVELGRGTGGGGGQGVWGPYQAPGFVVVQVDKSSDVIFAFLALGIHELLGFLVAELHVVPAAPPLPGRALSAWTRCGRGGSPAPRQLAAALQQLAHAAGLRDGMAHPGCRDGVHEGCLPDICRGTVRAGMQCQLCQRFCKQSIPPPAPHGCSDLPFSPFLCAVPQGLHPPQSRLPGAGAGSCKQICRI